MAEVSNIPLSDRITRERTFQIARGHGDDAFHQIILTLDQLLSDEKFTGQVVLHCSQGTVNSITAAQTQKVPG